MERPRFALVWRHVKLNFDKLATLIVDLERYSKAIEIRGQDFNRLLQRLKRATRRTLSRTLCDQQQPGDENGSSQFTGFPQLRIYCPWFGSNCIQIFNVSRHSCRKLTEDIVPTRSSSEGCVLQSIHHCDRLDLAVATANPSRPIESDS